MVRTHHDAEKQDNEGRHRVHGEVISFGSGSQCFRICWVDVGTSRQDRNCRVEQLANFRRLDKHAALGFVSGTNSLLEKGKAGLLNHRRRT
jgi:hypothetical protein